MKLGLLLFLALAQRIEFTGALGRCDVAQWRRDWPGARWEDGVSEGHVSYAERDGRRVLRVDYAPGEIGPEKGGCGWRYPIGGAHRAVELAYLVRFSKDFDWGKGGKLPGLGGGPGNVSGGMPADGVNGFSARLMWRREGAGEAYVYHVGQAGKYGDSFAFPKGFRFPTETWSRVRMRVEMNGAGQADGRLVVWVDDQVVVERRDLRWRSGPTFGVDSIYFETFHGGSDASWAPSRASSTEFSDVQFTVLD